MEATTDDSAKKDSVATAENVDGSVDTENTENTEDTEDTEDTESADNKDLPESDPREEVSALLGQEKITGDEESDILEVKDEEDDPAPEETVTTAFENEYEDDEEEGVEVSATDSVELLPDSPQMPAIAVESVHEPEKNADYGDEFKNIMESLHHSLTDTQYISSKMDAVSSDTERLVKEVNTIKLSYELITAELEAITSDGNTKNVLSKTFLTIASVLLGLLVILQIYMFSSLIKTERLQNAAGSTVLENISGLNKKMAEYDKNLAKALEKQVHDAPAPPEHAVAEKAVHETSEKKEAAPLAVTPVAEKLNKLRNGLPEKKLIRKETGDWFVYNNKKSEESISDIEIIEVLNQAYRRIGRSLMPSIPTPPNNALCILKPDGKGGTEVVMTKDFLP